MTILSVSADNIMATFEGTAKVNKDVGFTFRVVVFDFDNDPGNNTPDFFSILIKNSNGDIIYNNQGFPISGQIKIH